MFKYSAAEPVFLFLPWIAMELKKRKKESKTAKAKEIAKEEKGNESKKEKIPKEVDDRDRNDRKLIPLNRRLARAALIIGLMFIVYFSQRGTNEKPLVTSDETIQGKFFPTKCLEKGQDKKRCGRMITDALITNQELFSLLDLAKRNLKTEKILDLSRGERDGKKAIFKQHDKLTFESVKSRLMRLISEHFRVEFFGLYLTKPLIMLKMTKGTGDYAIENPLHTFTTIVDLSSSSKEFIGGRLIFIDSDGVNRTVEHREGRTIAFTNGKENMNYVEKVEKGERLSFVIGFTEVKKHAIADPTFQ